MSRVPQSARRRLGKLNEPHKCQVLLSASVSDFAVRLMRPHSETFGRGNILLFKSFCAMTLNASGLSRGRDTPYTRTPKAVCVLACVLCWLNANNVEHMNLRLKHVRNYEKLRLGPTPFSALYICYLCVCLCLYIIYFDKFIWQIVNEMPG